MMLCLAISGYAQKFNIRTFTNSDGLPLVQPLALHADSKGLLWVATYAGLTRYDGTTWRSWTRHDGLPTTQILCLAEAPTGELLIGYENRGLWRFDGVKPESVDPSLAELTVRNMVADRQGNIWLGGPNGLWVTDGQRVKAVDLEAVDFRYLVEIDRTVIVATRHRVVRYHDPDQDPESIDHPALASGVRFLAGLTPGRVLIGLDDQMLEIGDSTKLWPYPDDDLPTSVALDNRQGICWVGTTVRGIIGWTGNGWCRIGVEHGLPDAKARCFTQDQEGNLWVGTDDGLARYQPGPFAVYDEQSGLPHPFVRSLFIDHEGLLWAGTRRGPARHVGNRFEPLPLEQFVDPLIFDIDQDASGRMLFATRTGFTVLQDGQTIHYNRDSGLPSDVMVSVLVDAADRIWLGGQGLFEWRNQAFEPHLEAELAGTTVITMKEQSDGRIWLASGRGPLLYHPDTGSVLSLTSQIPATVWSIDEDASGRIWFATNGFGVACYDRGELTILGQPQGLPNEFVWQVLCHQNQTWVAHSQGISCLTDGTWSHYDLDDGIAELEASATACLVDDRGSLWFGSGKGVTKYSPSIPKHQPRPPGIEVLDASSHRSQLPLLNRDFGQLTLRFGAINLSGPTQYQYRLIGLDQEWSEASDQRAVTFASLAPGDYRFEVQAVSEQGLVSPEPAYYEFTVRPAIWETWPARIGAVIAALGLIWGFFRFRFYRLQMRRRELEEQVAQRTRALIRANQELTHIQEQLVETAHHAGMAETARQFLHLAGNTLNSMAVAIYAIRDYLKDRSEMTLINRVVDWVAQSKPEDVIERLPELFTEYNSLKQKRIVASQKELEALDNGLQVLKQVVRDQEDMASSEPGHDAFDLVTRLQELMQQPPDWLRDIRGQVELDIKAEIRPVQAARVVVMRIIRELLRNAVDAIDVAGGADHRILIRVDRADDMIVVCIVDSGIGLNPHEAKKAFNYGYSTKGASGYGLHYCACAVAELGGKLSLNSDGIGQGARCELYLPMAPQPMPVHSS